MTQEDLETRAALLRHYAKKEPRRYHHIDCWSNIPPHEGLMAPDKDGDSLTGGTTCELMDSGWEVRILIGKDVSNETAMRLLRKALVSLERFPLDKDDFVLAPEGRVPEDHPGVL